MLSVLIISNQLHEGGGLWWKKLTEGEYEKVASYYKFLGRILRMFHG